jgi:hypothetical protein
MNLTSEVLQKLTHENLQHFVMHRLATREIAQRVGTSPSTVARFLRRLGLKTKPLKGPGTAVCPHCKNCNKLLTRQTGIYCTQACQHAFNRAEWLQRWLTDFTFNPTNKHGELPERVRYSLISLRREKCEQCGWCVRHPLTGKIPVQVHHNDGNDCNNRPENLKLLCPNCHSLTPNWGARNKRLIPDPNPRRK